jgi:hypothetical protein
VAPTGPRAVFSAANRLQRDLVGYWNDKDTVGLHFDDKGNVKTFHYDGQGQEVLEATGKYKILNEREIEIKIDWSRSPDLESDFPFFSCITAAIFCRPSTRAAATAR